MHVFGVVSMALGVAGLLVFASHIAWQELRSLRYVSRLDEWGEDAAPWQ
jgi:hypothetical protein